MGEREGERERESVSETELGSAPRKRQTGHVNNPDSPRVLLGDTAAPVSDQQRRRI